MPSLYGRATPAQAKVLRIIEGAAFNAADAHGVPRDTWMARSIAKRAAGTLTAQWPEVLAVSARLPRKGGAQLNGCRACERRDFLARLKERRERTKGVRGLTERRASQLLRRPPLLVLWERIKRKMWHLSRTDPIQYEAHKTLLRQIHALRLELELCVID